jgi:hypothetical protein
VRALALILLVGCLHPSQTECDDGRICPPDKLCDDIHHACVEAAQLHDCIGLDDGTSCTAGPSPGVCDAGICVVARCGDNYRMAPEDCDGEVAPDLADCRAHGYHQEGIVSCASDCTFDFGACSEICGDGAVNGDEGCDDIDLDSKTCRDFGFYGESGLACTSACTFETAGCTAHGYCGDGIPQTIEGELCDMTLPDESCVTLGYDAGSLTCAATCTPALSSCRFVGWHRVSLDVIVTIEGIWGSAPDDVWAVGNSGVILHFDGVDWTSVTSPTTAPLIGVWGRSANEVYAVGSGGVMIRYDGSAWTTLPAVTANTLYDVWGTATEIWATGDAGTIVHHDGSAWSESFVGTQDLTGVWGFANDDVWVVGDNGTMLHYTTTWNTITPLTGSYLTSVWGSGPMDVYAADVDGGLFHYDGTWAPVTPPFAMTSMYALWGSGADDVFAATDNSLIYHFDGHDWSNEVMPPMGATTYLAGWSYDRTHSFVGGGDRLLVLGESAWTSSSLLQTPEPSGSVQAMWAGSPTDVFAVGEFGHIWHWDGTGVTAAAMTSPVSTILNGVYGTPSGVVFAVGAQGKILQYQSGTWSSKTSPTFAPLTGVWATPDASEAWASGFGVLVHYTTADGWKTVTVPGGFSNLWAVWGRSANDVWVGGSNSIGHYTGTWTWVTSPTSMTVRGIWAAAADDVYAVGDRGDIAHFDGVSWTSTRETDFALDAIHGNAADDIFAVGSGTVLHFDGVRWAPVRSPYSSVSMGAVWNTGPVTYVAGAGGAFGWLRRHARWRCAPGVDCSL